MGGGQGQIGIASPFNGMENGGSKKGGKPGKGEGRMKPLAGKRENGKLGWGTRLAKLNFPASSAQMPDENGRRKRKRWRSRKVNEWITFH